MDKTYLNKLTHDPNIIVENFFTMLETSMDGEMVITSGANPFTTLVEAMAVTGSNAVMSPVGISRKMYPNLAIEKNDLYHHLSDSELTNMFSTPAEVPIVFYLNYTELSSNGYRPFKTDINNNTTSEYENYVMTTLPEGTEVVINGVTFTLLNTIEVKLYDNGASDKIVNVEQKLSEIDIASNDLGVLPSGIVNFASGEAWVAFETTLKQVKKHTITKTITKAEGFDYKLIISDKYYHSDVRRKFSSDGVVTTELLNKTHSKEYINPELPTVQISIVNNEVHYKIPDNYILDDTVSGDIIIDIYETHGELYMPVSKYKMEEFSVIVPDVGTDNSEATISNISKVANSRSTVEGGSNGLTISELKDIVISRAAGDVDNPIRTSQIARTGQFNGFDIFKANESITSRTYIAAKNLPKLKSDLLYAKPDVFFNHTAITINEVIDKQRITNNNESLIIPSGTIFRVTNGVVEVLSDADIVLLETDPVTILDDTKHYYNPYHYVTDIDTLDNLACRVYDLNNPSMYGIRIAGKNNNLPERVNINQYGITRTDTGYQINFTLTDLSSFERFNYNTKLQLSIPLEGGEYINYTTDFDNINNLASIIISTDDIIDKNHRLNLLGGDSSLVENRVDLLSACMIYIYTTGVTDTYLDGVVVDTQPHAVLSYETINIQLGTQIETIWDRTYNTFDRKYLKHDSSKPLLYKEKVYSTDPVTGSILRTRIINGVAEVYAELLHNVGDQQVDDYGEPLYEYQAGDVVLDEDGLPVIDEDVSVIRNMDIMMLEYEFKAANTLVYKNYLTNIMDILTNWFIVDIPSINNKLLENTRTVYRSYKTTSNVSIITNNKNTTIPYLVRPTVTLYVNNTAFTDNEIELLKTAVGYIIHSHLDTTTISLQAIRDEIVNTLGDEILSAKITGLDDGIESELFNINIKHSRLVLGKKLHVTNTDEFVVKYDIDLNINLI